MGQVARFFILAATYALMAIFLLPKLVHDLNLSWTSWLCMGFAAGLLICRDHYMQHPGSNPILYFTLMAVFISGGYMSPIAFGIGFVSGKVRRTVLNWLFIVIFAGVMLSTGFLSTF